jgi:hypothetical protein
MYMAEAHVGGQARRCYLHVHDISRQGMCIETQLKLAVDTLIPMRFFFEEPLEVQVQVMWQTSSESGQMMGFRFVDLTAPGEAAIDRMMGRFLPAGEKRKSVRVDRCLRFEIEAEGVRTAIASTTLELGRGGMRISASQPLSDGLLTQAHIELESGQPPIEVTIRVAWQKPTSFNTVLVGLEFLDPKPEVTARIDRFVERVVSGTLDTPSLLSRAERAPQASGGPEET